MSIKELLRETKTCLIGRNGSIELHAMLNGANATNGDIMERHTGIWPKEAIPVWREAYIAANRECDTIAAGWYTFVL